MSFKHYLITRINLGFRNRIKTQNYNENSWLDYRFNLFYKTCFPSVINQNNSNFFWFIYLDVDTPENYVNNLSNKIANFSNIYIYLKKGDFGDLAKHVPGDIKDNVDPIYEYIITSRIDSDDLIHEDYIQEIQNQFDFQTYMSLNFTYGWVYDLKHNLLGRAKGRSNPFISLIEKINPDKLLLSVCYQSHTDFLFEKDRIEIFNKKRLWCMNMHDVNDSTKFYGLPIFSSPANLNQEFNFEFQNNPPFNLFIKYYVKFFKRQVKKILSYLNRRINNG